MPVTLFVQISSFKSLNGKGTLIIQTLIAAHHNYDNKAVGLSTRRTRLNGRITGVVERFPAASILRRFHSIGVQLLQVP